MSTPRLAVVSGISRGIGRAIAERLAADGYQIAGCGSSEQSLAAVRAAHPDWHLFPADLTQRTQMEAFAQAVLALGVPLELLVNNAGRFIPGQVHNEPEGALEDQFATNVGSAYHLTRAFLPSLMERRTGTVVNICSTASITAYTNGGSYCISKFALLGMTRVLREELKPHNIRVMAVLPGATYTDSWASAGLPESRFMRAADVAEVIATALKLPQGTVIEEILLRPMEGDIK